MKRFVPLLLLVSLFVVTASATTLRRFTLEEVRDRAESIFVGRVVSSSVRPVVNGQLVATDYTIEVQEVLAGKVAATTTVTYLGGKQGQYDMGVAGSPILESGGTYLFFRIGQPNNTTVGWGQGLYRVQTVQVGNETRTLLLSGDGEPLRMVDGKLSRGERMLVRDGALVKMASEPATADGKNTNGVATNYDGSPARAVRAVAAAAAPTGAFATLDDVRSFVRAGGAR